MFRTLKYIPAWPKRPFENLDEARQVFVTWYNTKHCHSGGELNLEVQFP